MMAGYVYRGTDFDAHKALPKPRKPRAAVAECGTLGGASRHQRLNEPHCPSCSEAYRAYKKDWRARVKANQPPKEPRKPKTVEPAKPKPKPRGPIECGTTSGYMRHKRLKEPRCQPCKDAYAEYAREWQARRPTPTEGWTNEKCGTLSGNASHHYYRVPVCAECKAVKSEYDAARTLARKAAA